MASSTLAQPVFLEKVVYRCPEPEMREPAGRVAEMIRGLSDEAPERRRDRAGALLEMGAGILPQLRWALQHGENGGRPLSWDMRHVAEGKKWVQDPRNLRPWHAEHELDVLISRLEEQQRAVGSLITLRHTNAWLTNVLGDFGRQAESDVSVGNFYLPLDWVNTNRVTVNAEHVNFWEAIQVIRETTGLEPVHLDGQNRLVLQKATRSAVSDLARSGVSGALRIVPVSATRLMASQDAAEQGTSVRLRLAAFAEPKLAGTGPHARVRIIQCIDDRGESLVAGDAPEFFSIESSDTWSWTVPLDLGLLGPGHRISRLSGEFSVGIGLMDRYMTITNLINAQGRTRELDGLTVRVGKVSRSGACHQVEVELSAPRGSPFAGTFSAAAEPEIWLWDEFTQTIVSQKVFNGIREDGERLVGGWKLITPENSPRPETLVWKTPTETRWHTVPFEIRDIVGP